MENYCSSTVRYFQIRPACERQTITNHASYTALIAISTSESLDLMALYKLVFNFNFNLRYPCAVIEGYRVNTKAKIKRYVKNVIYANAIEDVAI